MTLPLRSGREPVVWGMAFRMSTGRIYMTRVALLLCLMLAGCATPKIDWDARVGHYTYDQAVLELGPPDKSATLTDGTIVADWITRRAETVFAPAPYYLPRGGYFGPLTPMPTGMYFPARYLRLTFDAAGILKSWKQVGG